MLAALACLRPGGRLVINAIRKEDADRDLMATIRYEDHLWQEKEIKSVANVTRHDIAGFLLEVDDAFFIGEPPRFGGKQVQWTMGLGVVDSVER